jgi:hypothetical protein
MKINSGSPYLAATQRTAGSSDSAAKVAQTNQAEITSTDVSDQSDSSAASVDFTSMTRQEMRDWVNGQIRDGQMSLQDGSPFAGMTMKVSLNGDIIESKGDNEKIDFTQRVRDGINGAKSRNDAVTLNMLQTAMHIMQSKGNSVDAHA